MEKGELRQGEMGMNPFCPCKSSRASRFYIQEDSEKSICTKYTGKKTPFGKNL
jgi:hypothetical protein